MPRVTSLLAYALALVQLGAAAPSSNGGKMTVHWLHDKASDMVAIDVSAGDSSFAPISRQFCGTYSKDHKIDWDGFANNPLTVNIDESGRGSIDFQGQTHSTNVCDAKWSKDTVIVDCEIPYTGTLKPTLPDPKATACHVNLNKPGSIAHLSAIQQRSIAETHLLKREAQDLEETIARRTLEGAPVDALIKKRSPQFFGPGSCPPAISCTQKASDDKLDKKRLSKQVQITTRIDCGDGTCSVSKADTQSQTIGFSSSASAQGWVGIGFDISRSWSTTQSTTCNALAGERVCMWSNVPHAAYNVFNANCGNCGLSVIPTSGLFRMYSPFPSDTPYCVRNGACRTLGEGYYTAEMPW